MARFNIKNFIFSLRLELIVFLIMITSLSLFIGICKINISSDGVGYYDYLPSTFIHKDIVRNNFRPILRIDSMSVYVGIKGIKVNKFNIGVSLLQLPFFSVALVGSKIISEEIITGYEPIFQKCMLVGALFYYFLSLMFLRKTLQLFALSNKNIILTLLLFGLATNATQYINNEATFSHIYCMFLVSVFVFLVKKLQLDYKTYLIYLVSIVLGLLSITRLVDLLIIFSLPFIIGNSYAFKYTLKKIFIDKISIMIALFIFLLIASLQLIIWYLQYGSFFLDTYQAETFNFLKPELINFWFSYRKGLFLYTPITLISIVTGIILFFKKEYYLAFTFFLFFFLVSYVLSSWWSWWYSCGYGQRAFIGYYPVLFVFYALSLNYLKGLIKKIIIFISLLTIPVNHIQARQYKNFILNWEDMDRIKYWNVFLSNSNRFIGFNNKLNINEDYLRIRIRKKIKDQLILPNTIASIAQINMPLYEKGFIVKVTNYDSFEHNNRANLELCLKDKENDTLFFKNITYTNLTNSFLGESSQGTYYYRIPSVVNASNLTLTISTNQTPVRFKNAMFILFEIK